LGPNANKGKTKVPGDGSSIKRRWLEARNAYLELLDHLEKREADAWGEDYELNIYAREAEPFEDFGLDIYAREAESYHDFDEFGLNARGVEVAWSEAY
jgi:hypothetical protein